MNDPEAQIENFQERAAIMEFDASMDRETATLEAAKLVWEQKFTKITLKIHLMQLRQRMEKAA